MKIKTNSKLLMIGDSITDCERARPIGEDTGEELGRGYVSLVAGLLTCVYPERAIRVVNMGISGNTVRDLDARWTRDVMELKPDWLSIMIGINDVWRQFDRPMQTETHVPLEEYTETLGELVERSLATVKNVILMSPFYIESNKADPMRARMDEYGAAVKKIAARHELIFVDTQKAFDEVLAHRYASGVARDRVHPNMAGHAVLARAFLTSIGFAW